MEATAESRRRFSTPDWPRSRIALGAWAIGCVWLRYFDVFRKKWGYALITTYVEPLLYALSFGFGLGPLVGDVIGDGRVVHYRPFILSGILAQSVMFQGFFEAAYGGFMRMYYQRIFKAMATTPITLSEVLWGELLWDASKGAISAFAILLIGCVLGDFSISGAFVAWPLCFVGALLFSGLGLWVAGWSRTIEEISYPQYLIVFPMFLFCGIYFPLQSLPEPLRIAAWMLPLTPLVSLARSCLLGFTFHPEALALFAGWTVVLVVGSRRAMFRRLIP